MKKNTHYRPFVETLEDRFLPATQGILFQRELPNAVTNPGSKVILSQGDLTMQPGAMTIGQLKLEGKGLKLASSIGIVADLTGPAGKPDGVYETRFATVVPRSDRKIELVVGNYIIPPTGFHYQVEATIRNNVKSGKISITETKPEVYETVVTWQRKGKEVVPRVKTEKVRVDVRGKNPTYTVTEPPKPGSFDVMFSTVGANAPYTFVVGGELSPVAAWYVFSASGVDVRIKDVYVTVLHNHMSVDRIEAFRPDDTTPLFVLTKGAVGNEPMSEGTFAAHLSTQFVISRNSTAELEFRIRTKTDAEGGHIGYTQLALPKVTGVGLTSQANLPDQSFDYPGRLLNWVGAKATAMTNADPNGKGAAIPTGITEVAYKIEVGAHTNSYGGLDRWHPQQLVFNVDWTNVIIDWNSLVLYEKGNPSRNVRPTVTRVDADTYRVVASGMLEAGFFIGAGMNATYAIQYNVLNSKAVSSQPAHLQWTALPNEAIWGFFDALGGSYSIEGLHLDRDSVPGVDYWS